MARGKVILHSAGFTAVRQSAGVMEIVEDEAAAMAADANLGALIKNAEYSSTDSMITSQGCIALATTRGSYEACLDQALHDTLLKAVSR